VFAIVAVSLVASGAAVHVNGRIRMNKGH
jgi:hypothetical protein